MIINDVSQEYYKDMLEKLKYHKQLVMNAYIKNGYYPSNEEVNAALTIMDHRMSLFETYISKPGNYFNPTEINYCFEMIYKDIEILYKVLQEILANEYAQLKLEIEAVISELESKADYYEKKNEQESNATVLGTTLMFEANNWVVETQDETNVIKLGVIQAIEGTNIACIANVNEDKIKPEDITFELSNGLETFRVRPYNDNNHIHKIPGTLGINKQDKELGENLRINDCVQMDWEVNKLNRYKFVGGRGMMSVTYKSTGKTSLFEVPNMSGYSYYAHEDSIIEFYIVDANANEESYIEYSFNMAPKHCNFSLQDGTIKVDSDTKRIYIEAQQGLAFSFLYEQGECYAECVDAIIADESTVVYTGNLNVKEIQLREYVKSTLVPYQVNVYIKSTENISNNLNSIIIKEVD